MTSALKILVTSQKGGVGKSTVAANLSAYFQSLGRSVTLLDFDTHGSSSSWLLRAPSMGIIIQHHILPLNQGSNRPFLDARLHLRRASTSSDVVISDLTWSDCISGNLMFEYDLVIVPTSVSAIELAATSGFLNLHSWIFNSTARKAPLLLLCPNRVNASQMEEDTFSKQRFPVKFLLTPPVMESQSARDIFQKDYLINLGDICGNSFNEFCRSVSRLSDMHQSLKKTTSTDYQYLSPRNARTNVLSDYSYQNLSLQSSFPRKNVVTNFENARASTNAQLSRNQLSTNSGYLFNLKIPNFLKKTFH